MSQISVKSPDSDESGSCGSPTCMADVHVSDPGQVLLLLCGIPEIQKKLILMQYIQNSIEVLITHPLLSLGF